jgi:tRNA-specific 2-thiouridylase
MKIAVLLSGGVDSAVALRLLKEEGHDITAFYLKIWLEDELQFLGNCPWEEDLSYARAVCEQIDVPLEIIPLQKEYFEEVVSYTIAEVKAGRTPNPDVLCNSRIKFGLFLTKIDKSFEKVATGHYAQLEEHEGKLFIKRAPDPIKDQSYFLSHLKQDQLRRIIFPIGHLHKSEVRKLAEKFDLPNKTRRDSQGICFLGQIKFKDFINHYLKEKKGNLIEYETSKKLGEHSGFWYYTIGQRKDIRLSDGPWYVVDKDLEKNIVYVSKTYHDEDKLRNEFKVNSLNWFAEKAPEKTNLQVKLRHGEKLYDCKIRKIEEDLFEVKLNENDQGIAPGQFAVFYDGELCLGSGVIF